MNETKKKLYVDRTGFWAEAAVMLMVLGMVFRAIGSIGHWQDMNYLIPQLALPLFGGLLFVLFVLFFGKRAFWTTVIPVVLGVVFFIFRVMPMENEWIKVAFIALYVVVVVVYAMCFSHGALKWVLAGILALAFAYHLALQDLPALLNTEAPPVSFVDGMEEMSILAALLSVLCISLAMRFTPAAIKIEAQETAEPVPPTQLPAQNPAQAPTQNPLLAPTQALAEKEPAREPEEEPLPAPPFFTDPLPVRPQEENESFPEDGGRPEEDPRDTL